MASDVSILEYGLSRDSNIVTLVRIMAKKVPMKRDFMLVRRSVEISPKEPWVKEI